MVSNCPFKSHPDYNKEGAWEESAAYKQLKARFPSNKGVLRLSPKARADGTPLENPIELPKDPKDLKRANHKHKPGKHLAGVSVVALASQGGMDAPEASTLLRQCVISTNATNCLTGNVIFDTGAFPHNFVGEKVAAWIDAEDRRLPSECFLDAGERDIVTAVNLAGVSDMHVISNAVKCFNLLFLNEFKKTVELLPCLHARVIQTSFDIIIGLDTIRKANMILKIPRYFSTDETAEKLLLLCSGGDGTHPSGPNWFGTGPRPSGNISCETCSRPSGGFNIETSSRPSKNVCSNIVSTRIFPPDAEAETVSGAATGDTQLEETGCWFQVPVENIQSTTLAT